MTQDGGRSRGFERELLSLQPNLLAFAKSLCKDATRAEDLLQDTLLKALKNHGQFDLETNLKAWTFTIMRNEFYSQVRKRQLVEDPDGMLAANLSVGPAQEHALAMKEVRERMRLMPRDMRVALMAVAELGESYEAASEALGVAVGTVKSRVSRGRDYLERGLNIVLVDEPAESVEESGLSDDTIVAIQAAFADGASISELSARFGASSGDIMPFVAGMKRKKRAA